MPLAFPARALCALALLVTGLAAQDPHVFDAAQDLPGYEAASLSEWSDVYGLSEFKASDGKQLSAAELEALRARWKAEQERAQKRIAEIQADPRERWVWQLGKRLARHSYFSKIAYTIERPDPGFVMVLQHPAKEEPGYAARIAAFYMPFVKHAAQNFDEFVVQPAGLVRQEGHELTAFAVLASPGDLENFSRFVQDPTGYSTRSAYDYQLQLAVVYEDAFASGVSVVSQRSSLLYRIVKSLEHSYLAIPGNRPGSIWLYEGLASLFAAHEGSAPESLDKRSPRADSLEWLVELIGRDPAREIVLMPVDELVSQRSWIDFGKAVATRVKRLKAEAPSDDDIGGAYYAQSELWLHFLFDGAQGARRPQLLEFVKLAFRGRGDAQDFRRAFGATDLTLLSREFLRWACDEYERTHPGKKADRTAIDTLFSSAAQAAGSAPAADAPAAAPAPLVDPGFSPQMLAPAPEDAEAQLALALGEARTGNIAGALEGLHALVALAPSAPWPERIAREITRLEELAKLREGYLAFLKSSAAKLPIKRNGKDALAPVVSVEGGLVKLGENKLGLASIPLSEVDPYEIAKVAAKKEQQGGAQPWVRFYAYVLAGDARWEKLLKDDAPGAKELRADARLFPALLRTGAQARELYALSKLALPSGAADARARLERIQALLADGKGSELLARRTAALRQLATVCLQASRTAVDAGGLLHCRSEPLTDGRMRFTWEFDAPADASDWIRQIGYLKSWREVFAKIGVSEADSRFQVEKGRFSGTGQVCYRSAASFSGAVTVRLRYRYVSMEAEHGPAYFCLLVCDDNAGSYIVAGDQGFVRVRDLKQGYEREAHAADKVGYYMDQDLDFEFVHDGKEIATSLNQKPLAKAGCGPRKSGSVVLFMHMDSPLAIDRIVIEGRPTPESLRELETRWIGEQLAALGFP